MPVFDLAIAFAVFGLGLIGGGLVRKLWRKRPLNEEERGRLNLQKEEHAETLCCSLCDKKIDVAIDLYVKTSWYHRACYRSLLHPEGD